MRRGCRTVEKVEVQRDSNDYMMEKNKANVALKGQRGDRQKQAGMYFEQIEKVYY